MMTAVVMVMSGLLVAQVDLRGGEPAPDGVVVTVSAGGVGIGPPDPDTGLAQDATVVVGWDRVRRVRGDHAIEAAAYAEIADRAWRARTRLERGDAPAAEPLFEQLFDVYRGLTGPTSAVVAEGLLRCRLRRGAQVSSVDPWLSLLGARSGQAVATLHEDWAGEASLGPILDESTELAPALPPIWLSGPAVTTYASAPAKEGTGKAAVLDALYRHAARFESGLETSLPEVDPAWLDDPGVSLVLNVVRAQTGEADVRAEARAWLVDEIERYPGTWVEAWCRVALGRSLLREPSERDRRLGVVQLLHLPARFSVNQPYLVGVALAESAVALARLGNRAGADLLYEELLDGDPDHPALQWGPIHRWQTSPKNLSRRAIHSERDHS